MNIHLIRSNFFAYNKYLSYKFSFFSIERSLYSIFHHLLKELPWKNHQIQNIISCLIGFWMNFNKQSHCVYIYYAKYSWIVLLYENKRMDVCPNTINFVKFFVMKKITNRRRTPEIVSEDDIFDKKTTKYLWCIGW